MRAFFEVRALLEKHNSFQIKELHYLRSNWPNYNESGHAQRYSSLIRTTLLTICYDALHVCFSICVWSKPLSDGLDSRFTI